MRDTYLMSSYFKVIKLRTVKFLSSYFDIPSSQPERPDVSLEILGPFGAAARMWWHRGAGFWLPSLSPSLPTPVLQSVPLLCPPLVQHVTHTPLCGHAILPTHIPFALHRQMPLGPGVPGVASALGPQSMGRSVARGGLEGLSPQDKDV